jgi:hypothetical protein
MKGCSAVPVMGRVRHAATRDRDHRGHESVEKPVAIGKQKKIIPLNLGNKKRFFFCAAKKGVGSVFVVVQSTRKWTKGIFDCKCPLFGYDYSYECFMHCHYQMTLYVCIYIYNDIYIY